MVCYSLHLPVSESDLSLEVMRAEVTTVAAKYLDSLVQYRS